MRHLLDAATSAIPWVGVLCILVTIFLTLLSFGLVIPATPLRGWGLPNYQSNWGAGVTLQQVRRPKSALLHDVVDPSLLTSSWVVPAPALAAYRGVWAVYFILTLTLPTAAGYDNDPARNYLRFFTHWTITATALLGLWGPAVFLVDRTALGRGVFKQSRGKEAPVRPSTVDLAPLPFQRGEGDATEPSDAKRGAGEETRARDVEGGDLAAKAGADYRSRWRWYHTGFYILYTATCPAAPMLTMFFWALLYDSSDPSYRNWGVRASNEMVHGINVAVYGLDVQLSDVPLATYHWLSCFSYVILYEVYSWFDYAVGRQWAYTDVGWGAGINVAFVLGTVVLLMVGGAVMLGLAMIREVVLARIRPRREGGAATTELEA